MTRCFCICYPIQWVFHFEVSQADVADTVETAAITSVVLGLNLGSASRQVSNGKR